MATDHQITQARELATLVPHNLTAVDTGPWMVVQYVPDLGTGGAAATVTVAAGSQTLTFQVDAADPAGADAIGNTSGEFLLTAAANDTMGELVDLINAKAAWRAYLVGALRSELPSDLVNMTAASCFGANGKALFSNTSSSKEVSLAISGEKFINNGKYGHKTDALDQCENWMTYASINVTNASAGIKLRYYSGAQGSTETQIGSDVTLVSATAKEQGEANLATKFVEAIRGERLIVRAIGVSAQPSTAPVIHVLGKTAVLSHDRIVTEDNY